MSFIRQSSGLSGLRSYTRGRMKENNSPRSQMPHGREHSYSIDYYAQEQKQDVPQHQGSSLEMAERGQADAPKQAPPQRQLEVDERVRRGPGLWSICLSLLMSSLNLTTALFLIFFVVMLLFLMHT